LEPYKPLITELYICPIPAHILQETSKHFAQFQASSTYMTGNRLPCTS